MIKTFPIEFIRQALTQKFYQEHLKNKNFFGGKNQLNIASFYEQLQSQEQVDRFVETVRDLENQQNRTGLIGNGIVTSPENPTITNLHSSTVIPMSWACSMRTRLGNRDGMIKTINNLIEKLKGRKVDIAELNCVDDNGKHYPQPFMVGTVGLNGNEPKVESGDFVPYVITAELNAYFKTLETKGVITPLSELDKSNPKSDYWFYSEDNEKLVVIESHLGSGERIDVEVSDVILNDGQHIRINLLSEQNFTELPFIHSTTAFFTIFTETPGQTTPLFAQAVSTSETFVGKKVKIEADFTLEKTVHQYCQEQGLTFLRLEVDEVRVFKRGYLWSKVVDDHKHPNIVFPPNNVSFAKYKMSLSFESVRCDEPFNLNADEFCHITFGGSATIVKGGVKLGNDLLKIGISKYQIIGEAPISLNSPIEYLEPLEMPSGSNANTQVNQLLSNSFVSNSHTDAIAITLQYTFILDETVKILKEWFKYARYGTQGLTVNDVSPNMIYKVYELWCSWGQYENIKVLTKIVENVDIENTESDTLTLSVLMQVQGENN